jgi:endonuclease/exonuclease/phosphatase family metal-dependent hydrolase
MAASLKLETLNIWGGRVYGPLMEHVQKQEQKVDIFCFQEVYSTPLNRTHTRDSLLPHPPLHPTNDTPARANIYQELSRVLSTFHGHYASSQDRYDIHGPVDYILSFGLATFVKNTIQIDKEGDLFIHKEKNSVVASDNATLGRNLQYVQFLRGGKQFTIVNLHGLWNGNGKTDSLERIEQSHKIKAFLDSVNGAKILCGDFNLLPNTDSLAILEQGMRNLVKEYGITSTRSRFYEKPDKFADYILVSPEVVVEDFQVLDEAVSDHLPLLLEFRAGC